MVRIKALDALQKQLSDAQKALEALDGEIGSVRFDPHDPASIEAAIHQVEALIDARVEPYSPNPFISGLVEAMKEQYRAGLIDRAAQARLEASREP